MTKQIKRQSFVFYKSYYEAISNLPPETKIKCYDAIMEYGLEGNMPSDETDPVVNAVFLLVKPQIDANNKKYVNGLKGAEHGKKGGRPKKEENEQNGL